MTSFNCTALDASFQLRPDEVIFSNTDVIRRVHFSSPRWGHTRNIDALILGTKEEGGDYIRGVLGSAVAIACFISVWFFILLVAKCAGPAKTGLFSGTLMRPVQPGSEGADTDGRLNKQQGEEETGDYSPNQSVDDNEKVDDAKSQENEEDQELADFGIVQSASNDQSFHDGDNSPSQSVEDSEKFDDAKSQEDQEDADLGIGQSASNDQSFHDGEHHFFDAKSPADSASPSLLPPAQKPSVTDMKAWHTAVANQDRRLKHARITVLVSSLGITLCAILLLSLGIENLVKASDNTVDGIARGHDLAAQAVTLIDSLTEWQQETRDETRSVASDFNGFCPGVRPELCTDLFGPNESCNFSGIPLADEIEAVFNTTRDGLFYNELQDVRSDLVEFAHELEKAYDKSDNFNWAFTVASVFAGLLLVLNLFIGYGVIAAWCHVSKSNLMQRSLSLLRHWFLMPLFIFFVLMSWIFCMVFVIGSVVSSDMCVNDPDARMEQVLLKYGDFADSVIVAFLLFYIRGCPIADAPADFLEQVGTIREGLTDIAVLVGELNDDVTGSIQQVCGTDGSLVAAAGIAVQGTLCNLGKLLVDLQTYLSCENWRPLYRTIMYDAVCYNGNEGFYYISITQFCIVIFAMIMLTLRVAFYEVIDEAVGDAEERETVKGRGAWEETP